MSGRTQQERLYVAEAGAPTGPNFRTNDELVAWMQAELLDRPWWPERFPRVRGIYAPAVNRGNTGSVGTWNSDDDTGHIEMTASHRCAKYVCHEVAHVCAAPLGSTSHDPTFVRIYLELVYRTLGTEVWTDLRSRLLAAEIVIDDGAKLATGRTS